MRDVPCLHVDRTLARAGTSNGVGWWCPTCDRWVTTDVAGHAGWALPSTHPDLQGLDRASIPRVHAVAVPCEICQRETKTPELHHWCPRAIYADAETAMVGDGPLAYLCPPCHATWHQLVTPMLGGTMTQDRALALLRAWYRRWSPAEWRAFVAAVTTADAKVQRRTPPARPYPPPRAA